MKLAGQGRAARCVPPERSRLDDRGYIMVVLLIGMAVTAIWMSAALPAWRQQTQRQKEEDLIFRGEQYARAIVLFQDKNQGLNPPSIDVLVSQHYLRKKWKDPVTGEDFVPLALGASLPGQAPGPGTGQRGVTPPTTQTPPGRGAGQPQAGQPAGIVGVRSKSTATSIKIYTGAQQYNLWRFDAQELRGRMGRQPVRPATPAGDGRGRGDGRGGPGGPGSGTGPAGRGPGRGVGPGGLPQPPPPPPGGRGRGGGG